MSSTTMGFLVPAGWPLPVLHDCRCRRVRQTVAHAAMAIHAHSAKTASTWTVLTVSMHAQLELIQVGLVRLDARARLSFALPATQLRIS